MSLYYDKNDFRARISKAQKIRCTNHFDDGTKLLPVELALNKRYLQVNNDKVIAFLVIDLDHNNPMIWEDVGLPAPNFIVKRSLKHYKNRHVENYETLKNTSHVIYALEAPIFKNSLENLKTLTLFAKIQKVYTTLLKGDPLYVNVFAKNPLSEHWQCITNFARAYSLYELADYVELPRLISKREAIGEGRNCWLFETIRKWAYREVCFYKQNNATENDFRNVLLARLEKINIFENSQPLGFNELKNIAKSVSTWTWQRFSPDTFSEIQSNRRKKSQRIKTYTNNLEILKNELQSRIP